MNTVTGAARRAGSSATATRTAILITSLALIAACDRGGGETKARVDPDRRAHQLAREMQERARACEPSPERSDRGACERACELGHSNSCARLGALAEAAGRREPALAHYREACRGGSGVGCEGAARLSGDAAIYGDARRYHRVHCEQGYARSCADLAALYDSDRGGPASAPAADTYRRRACSLGWTAACTRPLPFRNRSTK